MWCIELSIYSLYVQLRIYLGYSCLQYHGDVVEELVN